MLVQNKKNKLNTALLAGSILLSTQAIKPTVNAASTIVQTIKDNNVVAHAADQVSAGTIGVDTASYQDTDLTKYKNAGAQFAIVKLTEGTTYVNYKAADQYASAQANGLMTMAYFFATFGTDSQEALNEARFFVQHAQAMGIPKGSYLAVDYESGDGNNYSTTDKTANTNAILNAMNYIKLSGYQPLVYTGQSFMSDYIDEARLSSFYPNSEWIAAYTQGYKAASEPIYNWKPPYPNMIMWQFTPNFNGQKTDASVVIQNMKNKPDMPAYIDSEGKGLNGLSVDFSADGSYTILAPPIEHANNTNNNTGGSNVSGNNGSGTDNSGTGTTGNTNTGSANAGTDNSSAGTTSNGNTNTGSANAGNSGANDTGNSDASGTNNSDVNNANNSSNNNTSNTGNSSTSNSNNTTGNKQQGGNYTTGSRQSVAWKKGFTYSNTEPGSDVDKSDKNNNNNNNDNNNVINLLPPNNDDNIISNQPLPSDKKEQEVKNEKIAQANNEQNQQNQNSSNDLGNSSSSTNSDLAQTSANKDKQNIWIEVFGLSAASFGLMKLQKKDDAE